MADFGDFSTTDFDANEFAMEDPTADFLAREKAMLGDDADIIASSSTKPTAPPADDDLFGFSEQEPSSFTPQNIPLPESRSSVPPSSNYDFTTTSLNQTSEPFHSMSGESNGFQTSIPRSSSHQQTTANYTTSSFTQPGVVAESEFVRNWRGQFQDRVGDRDRRERERQQQILEEAQVSLSKFQNEYQAKRQSKIDTQGRVTSNSNDGRDGKNGWSLVAHLVTDANSRSSADSRASSTKDIQRLHDLIRDLAQSGPAPQTVSR